MIGMTIATTITYATKKAKNNPIDDAEGEMIPHCPGIVSHGRIQDVDTNVTHVGLRSSSIGWRDVGMIVILLIVP